MNSPVPSSYKIYPLILWSLTPLHPGVGRAEGIVDLPVQRDALGYPVIYSSTLKGSLKSLIRGLVKASNDVPNCDSADILLNIFGGECKDKDGRKSTKPGKCIFTDLHLLLIPARSLKGVVIGVTSPILLRRLNTLLGSKFGTILNKDVNGLSNVLIPLNRAPENNPYILDKYSVGEGKVVINEVDCTLDKKPRIAFFVNNSFNSLANQLPYKAVAILDDDLFRIILRRSIEIRWRVKLEEKNKVVDVGPWSEEYVPPYSVFAGAVYGNDSLCSNLKQYISNGFFIGGDETIGAGLVKGVLLESSS